MLILGIDSGIASTGYGIVKKNTESSYNKNNNGLNLVIYGVIKTPVGMTMGERLNLLHLGLKKIIKNHAPDCLVLEQLFFGRNTKTAMMVG